MYRKSLKHITYFVVAATVIAVTASWGINRSTTLVLEPAYVKNFEPVDHRYMLPDAAMFVDSAANVISDPSGSLRPLMEKLLAARSGADSVISILHIGDSHIQAGYWTQRVRELFQADFGDAGRGLIVPYKLAGGGNEPRNYAVRTGGKYVGDRATHNQSGDKLSFTGVGVSFDGSQVDMEIWSKQPFCAMTIFHHPKAPYMGPDESLDVGSNCTIDDTPASTRLVLSRMVDTVKLQGILTAEYNHPTFYGFSLENGNPGVLYHAIGSNGAAFEHFTRNTSLLEGDAALLNPDLIIVSLGTNNCYGRNYRSSYLRGIIDEFVTRLVASYPQSAIMLTTPRESCSRVNRRTYKANPNIADAGEIITEIAQEKGIACWDLYSAGGGAGVSEKWVTARLAGVDRIHLTESGYQLVGDMFYDAFARYYNQWLCVTQQGGL